MQSCRYRYAIALLPLCKRVVIAAIASLSLFNRVAIAVQSRRNEVKRLCIDYKAIVHRLQSDCASIAKQFRINSAAVPQRTYIDYATATRLQNYSRAIAQRLQSDCSGIKHLEPTGYAYRMRISCAAVA
jgi:hypothetical protein